tara:strand:+ start:1331 stop:1546 length:216 start_codon:yes stop_codon:yes gene_type:complete
MIKVRNMNIDPRNGFKPETNMWCAHTMKDKNVIPIIEIIMALYPKIGFLELVAIISEVIPRAGKSTIYTSG